MPFIADWMEERALLWVSDKARPALLEILNSQREYIARLEEKGIPLWPDLSQELREKVLNEAYRYGATIMELDPDRVVDTILESLGDCDITLDREWAKANLLAFREDLASIL